MEASRIFPAPGREYFMRCVYGVCMGVEGSWYLISYNQDPTTPTIPSPSIIKVSEIPWFIVGLLVSIIGNQLSLINTY